MFTEGRKGEAAGRTWSLPSRSSGSNELDKIHRFKEDFHSQRREDPQAVQAESAALSGQNTQRTETAAAAAGIRVAGGTVG